MVDPVLSEQVVGLSPDDRRELFEAAQNALDPELTAVIDARETKATSAPASGRAWDEFRAELREQYGR